MTAEPKICFVLGAGFTCAYSDYAPTMANFLRRAEDAGVYKPKSQHQILSTISEKYFGSPTAANIEELATFLLVDHGSDPDKERELRPVAYDELLSVIRQTLATIYDNPRSETVKELFQKFAEFIVKKEICAITFNYDLLFDQLLRNTNEWFPIDGYGVHIPLAMPSNNPGMFQALEWIARARKPGFGAFSKMWLFKLHGSLNWGVRYMPKRNFRSQIELGMHGTLPIENNAADLVRPIERTSVVRSLGKNGVVNYFWRPFIVPPGLGNEPEMGSENVLAEIWYTARWLLRSAPEIHILGYSLPPSDFEADALIREGLYGWTAGSSRKRVLVVNKDTSVIGRFNRYARADAVQIEASQRDDVVDYLEDFLASE